MNFNVILFDDFETLDAFGPVEIIGRVPDQYYNIRHYSLNGGIVTSTQNVQVNTKPFSEIQSGISLFPGGMGVRKLHNNEEFIPYVDAIAKDSKYVLSVCSGSMLLASAKLLDNVNATTNKMSYDFITSTYPNVSWQRKARWVKDGKYYTSSGVSAGMDMALDFIADMNGKKIAEEVAKIIEYVWNSDKDNDPFEKV